MLAISLHPSLSPTPYSKYEADTPRANASLFMTEARGFAAPIVYRRAISYVTPTRLLSWVTEIPLFVISSFSLLAKSGYFCSSTIGRRLLASHTLVISILSSCILLF